AAAAAATPPGSVVSTCASPPPAGSSQRAGLSLSLSLPASGSGRREVNSSEPSGRNTGPASPSADLVSLRGGPPWASMRQMLVRYFFLSGLRVCTAAASHVLSGDKVIDPTRGIAIKSPRL